MRKIFLTIAAIFTVLGILFSFLPLDTIAMVPISIALIFSILAFVKSENEFKKLPKWLTMICIACAIFTFGKTYLIKDEVAKDVQFENTKAETKIEAKKDLEQLEKDLE